MRVIKVVKKYDGKKLSNLLFGEFEGLTNNIFNKAIRKKDIRINNVRVSQNETVHEGDEVKVYIIDELLYKTAKVQNIETVYEDENIVVFNKPSNIEVTGGENTLERFAQSKYNSGSVKPCHRIDRNTTGLVLFAKNDRSLTYMQQKFKEHKIIKHYRCIVVGIPKVEKATMSAYLFKDNKKAMAYISDEQQKGYREIITSYKVIKKDYKENLAVLDVEIPTGRTHQIRAHLAHIGFPILGDGKYGVNAINKKFKVASQQLCSYSLEFSFEDDDIEFSYLKHKKISLNNCRFEIKI